MTLKETVSLYKWYTLGHKYLIHPFYPSTWERSSVSKFTRGEGASHYNGPLGHPQHTELRSELHRSALQVEFITGVKLISYFVLYYCFLH